MALKLFQVGDASKAQISAIYAGLALEVVPAKDNKEYKKHSTGLSGSLLLTPNGPIAGSLAILRYVARCRQDSGLYGQSFFESGQVDQWIDFCAETLEPPCQVWILPVNGVLAFDGRAYSQAKKDVADALGVLDAHLKTQTFLVGERLTIADIAIATTLVELYRKVFDKNFRKKYANLNRWFDTCVHQMPFQSVLGDVVLTNEEKRAPKPAKQKGGNQQQKGGNQQKGGQKGQQKGQQKKQKAQQPQQPKKPKDPLLALPKSSMILDAEKKQMFLKKPTNPNFFPGFWDRFDAEGYSCWVMDYNYNSENKVYFMTCNLLGGFIQRSDAVRKFALGCMNLVATDDDTPPFEVSGAWVFRGGEIPQQMKDNPDSEYFTWKKLDVSKPAEKKEFEDRFQADKLPLSNGTLAEVQERRFFK